MIQSMRQNNKFGSNILRGCAIFLKIWVIFTIKEDFDRYSTNECLMKTEMLFIHSFIADYVSNEHI